MPTRARARRCGGRAEVALFLALASACATAPAPAPATTAPPPPTTASPTTTSPTTASPTTTPTERYRVELARAARLGRTLYLHDKASALGTDAYLDHVARGGGTPVGGYLSLRDADAKGAPAMSFTVLFFTRDAEPRIAYRVHVPLAPNGAAVVEDVAPPAAPSPEVAALIRARQAALAALPPTVQPLNPIVLTNVPPAFGEDGILVYLLAGTKRPAVAVFGLHHRVLVSSDGRQVLRVEPLSKGPLEQPLGAPPPHPGAIPVGLVTSHSITDYPLETHVFESLLYGLPLSLVTPHGIWHVDGERLTFGEPTAAPASPPACASVCSAAVGRCPRGPRDQADCLALCERLRAGACADRYDALFTCAGAAPEYACDGRGALTVRRCEREYETLLRCFARD